MTEYLDQLSNLSVTEAGELLATTAVLNRRARAKTALDLSSIAKSISEAKTPGWEAARNGLVGAGVGAGVGALSSLSQPRGRRRTLSNAAQGALLGGLVGGGGTLAFRHMGKLNETADSSVRPRITEIERELRRNAARGVPDDMSESLRQELATLNERLPNLPPDAPQEGPPGLTARLPSAMEDLASGHPIEAARTYMPNEGGAAIGAATGAAGGALAGKGVEMGVNKAYLGNRVANMGADELEKIIGKGTVPGPTQANGAAGAPVGAAAKIHADANATKPILGRRPLPASAKPFTPALKAKAPRIGSKFFPRGGGIVGGIIGAGLGGGMGESDYAGTSGKFQTGVPNH